MGGDRQAEIAAEYWCKRLAGRPASFAGPEYSTKTRKVAILTADTPATAPAGDSCCRCCRSATTTPPSCSSTPPTPRPRPRQSTTMMAQLRRDGITSVLWFSDPIAPVYATAR